LSSSFCFPHQNCVYISHLPTLATCPAHLALLDLTPKNIWRGVQITAVSITELPPVSSYFFFHLSTSLSIIFSYTLSLNVKRQTLTPTLNIRHNYTYIKALIFILLDSTLPDKILWTERQQPFAKFNFILISLCMEL
jgi:hypothetical protein